MICEDDRTGRVRRPSVVWEANRLVSDGDTYQESSADEDVMQFPPLVGIRVGSCFQADLMDLVLTDDQVSNRGGELVWSPAKAKNVDLEQFLAITKYVEKTSQAFPELAIPTDEPVPNDPDPCSMEDVLQVLHSTDYDVQKATQKLTQNSLAWVVGSTVTRSWSPEDIESFENGLLWAGREPESCRSTRSRTNKFAFIQRRFLPHKTVSEIVSFYYHWKMLHPHSRFFKPQPQVFNTPLEDIYQPPEDFQEDPSFYSSDLSSVEEFMPSEVDLDWDTTKVFFGFPSGPQNCAENCLFEKITNYPNKAQN